MRRMRGCERAASARGEVRMVCLVDGIGGHV